jgi:hypothetical protein
MNCDMKMNSDNQHLMPLTGNGLIIGSVDEVNGRGAEEITSFVPTRHELIVIVKYWAEQTLSNRYFEFVYAQTGSSEIRLRAFANRRIARIEDILGAEAIDKALEEAQEGYKKEHNIDPEEWRIFTSGTPEEWDTFQAKVEQEMDAYCRRKEATGKGASDQSQDSASSTNES